jgi:hypothetical protein
MLRCDLRNKIDARHDTLRAEIEGMCPQIPKPELNNAVTNLNTISTMRYMTSD